VSLLIEAGLVVLSISMLSSLRENLSSRFRRDR
jgi:hypothetical protein